jgi:hypothetical protein
MKTLNQLKLAGILLGATLIVATTAVADRGPEGIFLGNQDKVLMNDTTSQTTIAQHVITDDSAFIEITSNKR